MIVAPRAANRHAEEDGTGGVDHVHPLLNDVHIFDLEEHVAIGADAVEARAGSGLRVIGIEFIARNLLFGEAIVRLVVIERLDDVVAVAPGDQQIRILLETGGIAITREIEPVSSPFFAIARRRQQTVDHLFPGIGRAIPEECVDLLFAGRETQQIVGGAPKQREPVGLG